MAEAAELSKGTLYLYFINKEDIHYAICLRGMDLMAAELQEAFDLHYRDRFKGRVRISYVHQDTFKKYEDGYIIKRAKPWGTGHAMLSVHGLVNTPFAIINADDFYGKTAFTAMAGALNENVDADYIYLLGYKLKNTLSDHGTVSRGLCHIDHSHYLKDIRELTKIGKKEGGIYYEENGDYQPLRVDDLVSMNFWGFMPNIFEDLDKAFRSFIETNHDNAKAEFYIPTFVDLMLKAGKVKVKVLSTEEQWLGVTYREDKQIVAEGIRKLIDRGVYPARIT